jgi:hypothetical protein
VGSVIDAYATPREEMTAEKGSDGRSGRTEYTERDAARLSVPPTF